MCAHERRGLCSVDEGSGQFAGLVDAELGSVLVGEKPFFYTASFEWKYELTALSRNSRCSLVRGRRRFPVEGFLRDSGCGSVDGGSEEVVMVARRTFGVAI